MKTVKTLHFDAINTMYISAQCDFDCPRRAGVFVCLRAIGDNCRLFCFDTFGLDYVYCCFGVYGITMPSVWCFLRRRNACGLVVCVKKRSVI